MLIGEIPRSIFRKPNICVKFVLCLISILRTPDSSVFFLFYSSYLPTSSKSTRNYLGKYGRDTPIAVKEYKLNKYVLFILLFPSSMQPIQICCKPFSGIGTSLLADHPKLDSIVLICFSGKLIIKSFKEDVKFIDQIS